MSELMGLKAKLGLDVFKPNSQPHIAIKPGKETDPKLNRAILVCPAGLYTKNSDGKVEFNEDGCLECGTCRIACGSEVLDWSYPVGGYGVQYRFG